MTHVTAFTQVSACTEWIPFNVDRYLFYKKIIKKFDPTISQAYLKHENAKYKDNYIKMPKGQGCLF